MRKFLGVSVLIGAFLAISNFTYAEDQQRDQDRTQLQDNNEQMYGSQLMTGEERIQQRAKMLNANSEAEREQIRSEHHQLMFERAKERGITIPEDMPHGDYRMGSNKGGMGVGGMGPGGMGAGAGNGKGQ